MSLRKQEQSTDNNYSEEKAAIRTQPDWYQLADKDSEMSDPSDLSDSGNVNQIMPTVTVNVTPESLIPTRGTEGSAGWDCQANQSITLQPGRPTKVDIGLRAAVPVDWGLLLYSRSKLACEGITVEAGLIDSDYRGVIHAVLYNHTHTVRRIQRGEKICQLIFLPVPTINWQVQSQLDETERGDRGFGHTDQ